MKILVFLIILTSLIFLVCSFSFGTQDNVSFYLYSSSIKDKVLLTDNNTKLFKSYKPAKILIHGYAVSSNSTWIINVARKYVRKEKCNVLTIDWSKLSEEHYYKAYEDTEGVAESVADALLHLYNNKLNLLRNRVHIIGHSMGAHVAGKIGDILKRKVDVKIARITGLDPAGPLYENYFTDTTYGLHKSNAQFVDVIHTSVYYGVSLPMGHVNFYPNGGRQQPQCISKPSVCSHSMAHQYFEKSIESPRYFSGTFCKSWNMFMEGKCKENRKALMGEATPKTTRGHYFLTTNFMYDNE